MPEDRELKLKIGQEGAKETASAVGKVGEAVDEARGATKKAGEATEEAGKKQEKLTAAISDYAGVLDRLSPGLGAWLQGMFQALKISGDLASANINLTSVLAKAKDAILGNAAALKLIGAGGLVVGAIFAITAALRAMKEEAEAVRKSTLAASEAINELLKQRAATQQSIETIRDASGLTPFSADEARAAGTTAQDLKGKPEFGFLDEAAIAKAIALAGGRSDAAGGGQLGLEQIAALAFAIQSGKADVEGKGTRTDDAIERTLQRTADVFAKVLERERAQAAEQVKAALGETTVGPGGSTGAIEEVARKRTQGTSADASEVSRIVQVLPLILEKIGESAPFATTKEDREAFAARVSPGVILKALSDLFSKGEFNVAPSNISAEEINFSRQVLTELNATVERMGQRSEQAAKAMEEAAHTLARTPPVVNYTEHVGRKTAPSAAVNRAAITNGQTRLEKTGV